MCILIYKGLPIVSDPISNFTTSPANMNLLLQYSKMTNKIFTSASNNQDYVNIIISEGRQSFCILTGPGSTGTNSALLAIFILRIAYTLDDYRMSFLHPSSREDLPNEIVVDLEQCRMNVIGANYLRLTQIVIG